MGKPFRFPTCNGSTPLSLGGDCRLKKGLAEMLGKRVYERLPDSDEWQSIYALAMLSMLYPGCAKMQVRWFD